MTQMNVRWGWFLSDLHFNQFNSHCEINIRTLGTNAHIETDKEALAADMYDTNKSRICRCIDQQSTALKRTGRSTVSFSAPAPKTPWKYIGKHIDVCNKKIFPNTKTKFKYNKKQSRMFRLALSSPHLVSISNWLSTNELIVCSYVDRSRQSNTKR